MKLGRCPICHSHLHLDALVQDAAGRQVLGLISKLGYRLAPVITGYIALFRPEKRDLANDRALQLIEETLALTNNQPLLAEALRDTLEQLYQNRLNGKLKPLSNHNYLKKVIQAKASEQVFNNTSSTVELKHQENVNSTENQRLFEEQMKRLGGKVLNVPK